MGWEGSGCTDVEGRSARLGPGEAFNARERGGNARERSPASIFLWYRLDTHRNLRNEKVPEVDSETAASLDAKIAAVAMRKIEESGTGGEGMLLSVLGNRISDEIGSLRQMLGRRTSLRRILEEEVGDRLVFKGLGNRAAVQLVDPGGRRDVGSGPQVKHARRFDKTFWAAFAKPVRIGSRRFIKPTRPYDFSDEVEEFAAPQPEWIEVEASRIPSPDVPRHEREAMVHAAIDGWCEVHGLNPERFTDLEPRPFPGPPPAIPNVRTPIAATGPTLAPTKGVEALLRLIEAVPTADRPTLSLPLDLIHKLISRP